VGLPRDGDPRAGFAIIDDNKIELKRVDYPVADTIARIEEMPWPQRGKDLMSYVLRYGYLPQHLDHDGTAAALSPESDPDNGDDD
jgi:hypothetical protein